MPSEQTAPKKTRWPFFVLGLLLLLMLALLVLLSLWLNSPERVAKAKLDSLLNNSQTQPHVASELQQIDRLMAEQRAQAEDMGGLLERLSINKLASSASGVQMNETEKAYELHFAIDNADDAKSIAVDVTPRRIQINARRVIRNAEGRETGSSSFMQMFSPASEVLPDKVTRSVIESGKGKELVVTIPKKYPGQKPVQAAPEETQASPSQNEDGELSPDVLKQLQRDPRFI